MVLDEPGGIGLQVDDDGSFTLNAAAHRDRGAVEVGIGEVVGARSGAPDFGAKILAHHLIGVDEVDHALE